MASPDWDGKTAIKKAREYGFQGVDIRISDHLGELKVTSSDAEIKELKKIFAGEGIISSSILSYNDQAGQNLDSWGKMEASILRNLDIGTKLGTKLVRIFIGNPDCANDHDGFINHAAEVLARVLKIDGSSTSLIIQNHVGGVGINDILSIMKLVKSPRLNMALCPANATLMGEDFNSVITGIKDTLPQLYIADILQGREFENGFKPALPGKGEINYEAVYGNIGREHFKGWFSFKWEKIWVPEIEGTEIALPYFIDYMKKLMEG